MKSDEHCVDLIVLAAATHHTRETAVESLLNQPPRAPRTPSRNRLFFSVDSMISVVLPSDRLKLTHELVQQKDQGRQPLCAARPE